MSPAKDGLIVVAGAGGFIGGHLVASLRRQGFTRIRPVDIKPFDQWHQCYDDAENLQLDLRERDNCVWACHDAVEVYNLAADMGGMNFIAHNKTLCMLSVLINTHMLMAARDAGAYRYFYASSSCVYNTDRENCRDGHAIVESDAYPAMPQDGYGWEKLFSERMCRHFREDFGLETRVGRPHSVYGPHCTWEGPRTMAPAAFCRQILEAKYGGRSAIEIWGDGEQARSFTWIGDCVHGIDLVAHGDCPDPLNIGISGVATVNELVTIIERIAGIRVTRRYDPQGPVGVRGCNLDNAGIRDRFGWEPSTQLCDGMVETYRWVHDAYAKKHGVL